MVEVVAGLILDGNKFLIGRRPPHKARGMLWEFVGGKTEAGESKEEALERECMEELGVSVAVGEEFFSVVHEYPDITVRLTIFRAEITAGTIELREHSEVAWITKDEIDDYAFCPADKTILEKIKREL